MNYPKPTRTQKIPALALKGLRSYFLPTHIVDKFVTQPIAG
jgi:hypothetical protein